MGDPEESTNITGANTIEKYSIWTKTYDMQTATFAKINQTICQTKYKEEAIKKTTVTRPI